MLEAPTVMSLRHPSRHDPGNYITADSRTRSIRSRHPPVIWSGSARWRYLARLSLNFSPASCDAAPLGSSSRWYFHISNNDKLYSFTPAYLDVRNEEG